MSLKTCSIDGCKERPYFHCSCKSNLAICANHIDSHLSLLGYHKTTNLFTFAADDIRPNVNDYFNTGLKLLNENIITIKENTIKLIKSITLLSNKLIKDVQFEKKDLIEKFKFYMTKTFIDTEILKSIIDHNKPYEYINASSINNIFDILNEIVDKKLGIIRDAEDDYALVFRTSADNHIDLVDLNTYTKKSINFNSSDFYEKCICCKIDKNRYFIYGGNPQNGSVKIINIQNNTLEILSPSSNLCNAGAYLLHDEIYIFGGSADGRYPTSACKKFNIYTKIWNSIQPLPESNDKTSISYLDRNLNIVGFQSSKIFIYNPYTNTFTSHQDILQPCSLKILVKNWLVCCNSYLYEIDSSQNFIRRCAFLESCKNFNSSGISARGSYLYFVLESLKLIRIDTERKKIEVINYD